ncbi:hypothetical protein ACSAZK_12155 [Methanosarcina sp. Mfa9]|uniref:hypothetical protein n=1 Tax=Methanosarcina sp. Mfa9 TaxID=3439063 RepID=UPI003F838DFC
MLPVKKMTEGRSKERKTIEEEIEKGIKVEKITEEKIEKNNRVEKRERRNREGIERRGI